jgi:hypothetical protein
MRKYVLPLPRIPKRSSQMIGFESGPIYLHKLRERLKNMADEELISFGKYARKLAGMRVSSAIGRMGTST